jgi:hypothetical protein
MSKITFQNLIVKLSENGNKNFNQLVHDEKQTKEITSIRLRPQTRQYLKCQSEALGLSVSEVINIILDGVIDGSTTK